MSKGTVAGAGAGAGADLLVISFVISQMSSEEWRFLDFGLWPSIFDLGRSLRVEPFRVNSFINGENRRPPFLNDT